MSFINDWLISGVSASLSKTIVAPIERTKLILQVQETSCRTTQYKGILDCLKRLPKEQGFLSFWRGNWINICRYFPTQAFNFAFNTHFKGMMINKTDRRTHLGEYLLRNCACGGMAGGLSQCIVHPLNICFTMVATDIRMHRTLNRKHVGLRHCITEIMGSDGVRGFYRGFSVAVAGVVVYRGIYFGFYDTAKQSLEDIYVTSRLPFVVSWIVAQIVTCSAAIIAYPFDTVGRRMIVQTRRLKSEGVQCQRTLECIKSIIKTKGVVSLYKGGLTNTIRSISGALVLVFYDEMKYQFLTPELRKSELLTTERYHQYWRKRYS